MDNNVRVLKQIYSESDNLFLYFINIPIFTVCNTDEAKKKYRKVLTNPVVLCT